MWRSIKSIFSKDRMKNIKTVETWDGHEWIRTTGQQEVENSIMKENHKRFHLTESTPWMQDNMVNQSGYTAEKIAATEVWQGTYDSRNVETREMEYNIRMFKNQGFSQINTAISRADFIAYWKKAKEKTASSVSGLHFGHYKAATDSNMLSELHAKMLHMSFNSGIPLHIWTEGLTCMLEKKKD